MPSLLARCDLAVCGAGATCWEMAYMGVVDPADRARAEPGTHRSSDRRTRASAAASAGITRERCRHRPDGAGRAGRPWALAAMQARAQSLFDGCGAERVAQEIADLAVAGFVPAAEVA